MGCQDPKCGVAVCDDKAPTIGWRAVNNAFTQNKHTIPYCSLEPPTT